MKQICPTCRRDVGDDRICAVCGPVVPIVVQFDPKEAANRRAAGQSVAGGATTSSGGGTALLLTLVLLGGGGWYYYQTHIAGKDIDKNKANAILGPLHKAVEAGDYAKAEGLRRELEAAVPNTEAPRKIGVLLTSLKKETPERGDLATGYEAATWLNGRTQFSVLIALGSTGRDKLDRKVLDLVEVARTHVAEGKHAAAIAIYDTLPEESPNYDQIKKERGEACNKQGTEIAAAARAALGKGDLVQAEKLAQEAADVSWGPQKAELNTFIGEIRNQRAAKGRSLYHQGQADEALEMLSSLADVDGVGRTLSKRIRDVVALADKAEALMAEGKKEQAIVLWQKVLAMEPEAGNAYVKRARAAGAK